MEEIISFIEVIVSSKAAISVVAIAWVVFEIRAHREDKMIHIEERKEWAERIERLTASLNDTIRFLERRDVSNVNQMSAYRRIPQRRHDDPSPQENDAVDGQPD
jgi:hypothetical protein